MSQDNGLNVEPWPTFQSGDGFTRNDWILNFM